MNAARRARSSSVLPLNWPTKNSRVTSPALAPTPPAVLGIAAAYFALLMAVAPRYGYFRDELYYLACGEHPAWGYVDQPPLIAWIAWLLQHTIGTSLYALRLLPALAAAAAVWVTARLAREFGGDARAQVFAALLFAVMPIAAVIAHLFTMNIFDMVSWTALALLLARLENSGNLKLWLAFGALAGVTILNKYGVLFFIFALLAGIVATHWRRCFTRTQFWMGALLATAIALPNFLWQWRHHFPFLELMHNVRQSGRDIARPPLGFFLDQLQAANPVSMLVAIAGVIWLLRSRRYRALGIAFPVFYLLMMVLKAKLYYLAPAYPMVFAAGAVAITQWSGSPRLRWLPSTIVAFASLVYLLMLPLLLPVLDVAHFEQYVKATGIKLPEFEHRKPVVLPQIYSDMFGWPEMVAKTAAFYNTLTPEQKQRTVIYGDNYGVAAAIDFFGPRYGLPKAISGHQSYFLWGAHGYHHVDVIDLGSQDDRTLQRECDSVTVVGETDHPLARGTSNFPIYYCQGLRMDITEAWPKTKKWD
jgi:hypothetical protein